MCNRCESLNERTKRLNKENDLKKAKEMLKSDSLMIRLIGKGIINSYSNKEKVYATQEEVNETLDVLFS